MGDKRKGVPLVAMWRDMGCRQETRQVVGQNIW